MSITASELKVYGSVNMPTGDSTTAGGAIDTTTRIIFDSATIANSFGPYPVAVVSTLADTQNVVVYGRNVGGAIVTEQITLAGTAPVTGAVSFDRILMVDFLTSHNGTVTVRQGGGSFTTLATMESGVDTLRRPFYNVVADAAGGTNKVLFEKMFVKNTNATLTLTSATLSGSSAGLGSITTFALESGYNGSTSVANRLAVPTGTTTFDNSVKNIVGGNLPAGSGAPVWLRLQLDAGTSPQLGTYTLTINGNTT